MIETTARRIAAHPKIQFASGMRVLLASPFGGVNPYRLYMGSGGVLCAQGEGDRGGYIAGFDVSLSAAHYQAALDLNDAATIGTIEAQARTFCPGMILFPPEKPGDMWAINKASLTTCLAYAPSIGECWALAFLEVAK